MPLPWSLAMLAPFVLVFARVAGLAWTAPGLSTNGLGWRIRVGLAILLTLAVAPAATPRISAPNDLSALARFAPIELAVGAMLGLSASLVLAGARQAGELVGVQAGLSPASLLDPEAGEESNPIAHLYGWMALGAFLALDGPLALVGSLIESYRAIPAGGLALSPETVDLAFSRLGWALGLALRAAAPAGIALIAAGVAMGMLGRAAPSLSLLSYSLPIRVGVGLVLVLIGLAALAGLFASAWGEIGISFS
jgi:flagellar biosynthesis protein FliR